MKERAMAEDDLTRRPPPRRGRETHAEEVARAMRENLKKRKQQVRARRAGTATPPAPADDDDGEGSQRSSQSG
jgi:hypothetical protein